MSFKDLKAKRCLCCKELDLMDKSSVLCHRCRNKRLRGIISGFLAMPNRAAVEVIVSEKFTCSAWPLGFGVDNPFTLAPEEWMPDDNIVFRSPKFSVVFYRSTGDILHIPAAQAYSADEWIVSAPTIGNKKQQVGHDPAGGGTV